MQINAVARAIADEVAEVAADHVVAEDLSDTVPAAELSTGILNSLLTLECLTDGARDNCPGLA
jgi:hypothetical protein